MVRCSTRNVFRMRQFCRFFQFFFMTWYVKFNRLTWPNDKMNDHQVFADRNRFKLSLLEMCILIYIACEIVIAKVTSEICRISNCWAWFDMVEINRVPYPNDEMCNDEISLVDPAVNRLYRYLDSFMHIFHVKQLYQKSQLVTSIMWATMLVQYGSEALV